MPELWRRIRIPLITVLVAAIIVYGSLYPFEFYQPANGVGPLATLMVWDHPSRSGVVANVLLYMPLGFFFVLGSRDRARQRGLLVPATAVGCLLSLTMEWAQYYDVGRVTNLSDVVTNTLGTLIGGLIAILIGGQIRLPLIGEVSSRPIPAL